MLHQVEPAHPARHQEVGEEQVDVLLLLSQDLERGRACLRLEDRIAEPGQLVGHKAADMRLVLHEQNALVPARAGRSCA